MAEFTFTRPSGEYVSSSLQPGTFILIGVVTTEFSKDVDVIEACGESRKLVKHEPCPGLKLNMNMARSSGSSFRNVTGQLRNVSSLSQPCTSNLVGGVSAEPTEEDVDDVVSCETERLLRRTSEVLGEDVFAIFFAHNVADVL